METEKDLFESFNPIQCIASKVMKINRIVNETFRRHFKPFDLSNSQIGILFVLTKRSDLSQNELAEFLYLEKSSMSRNLQRLLDKDLVAKKEKNKLSLTDKSREILLAVIPEWEKAMEEIRAKIGEKGEDSLSQMLQTLIK